MSGEGSGSVQRTLWPVVSRILAEVSDRDLLERYVRHDDQGAFTQLVMRYNRLVWGQCRNLLANDADTEDAFQATFLTLARSAKKVNAESPLGPWLHGVAYRVCMNARRATGRRAKREKAAARPDAQQPVADSAWEKAFAAVAEEVQKLPEALRVAFVLSYLEGRSAADAAARLGLKHGTFTARLTRAKQALLERLARRGLGAGILALGAITESAAVAPAALVERTLALLPSGSSVPGSVRALTHGVAGMTMTPLKLLATAVVATTAVAVTIVTGAGAGWSGPVAAAPVPKVSAPDNPLFTPDTRKAIDAGLEYLAKNQADDGSWVTGHYRGNVAGTALAGRAFLAAGHQPGQGPNGARLTRAVEYILKNKEGGLLAQGKAAPMEEHGFAVHFLADGYGKVTDKALKEQMKATLTRAVKVIADGQNREGGWRYQPNSKDADLGGTCCQLHALAAAKRAGFEVPQATIDNGITFILSCRDLNQSGKFRSLPTGGPSVASAEFAHTAAAISALNAVGFKGEKEVLADGTEFLRAFKSPGASDAFFSSARCSAAPVMKALGGNDWDEWYSAVRDALLERRNKDGVWGDAKTSHSDTALALITLQAAN